MPPHLKQRADRGGYWYLVDGDARHSLGTTRKGLAQYKLEQYIRGEFGLGPQLTVKQFYDKWIDLREKEENQGLIRKSAVRDYKQHFTAYILPEFGARRIDEVTVAALTTFRSKLLKNRTFKTARNVIDGSFRAMWRAIRTEKLSKEEPFERVEWPRKQSPKPDPFTAEERDKIIEWWAANDIFYYPWVAVMFETGMRPSEASALRWTDVDLRARRISITKSRNLGKEAAPKTKHSDRTIVVSDEIASLLAIVPSRELGLEYVFVNKLAKPMDHHNWAHDHWAEPLTKLGIRHRKFYATRHTFITEAIRAGENPLAVAQHSGNSLAMIQENYCGRLTLDRTISAPSTGKQLDLLVVPTGIEPVNLSARMSDQVRQIREFKRLESRKLA